jgi:hypothetical protein
VDDWPQQAKNCSELAEPAAQLSLNHPPEIQITLLSRGWWVVICHSPAYCPLFRAGSIVLKTPSDTRTFAPPGAIGKPAHLARGRADHSEATITQPGVESQALLQAVQAGVSNWAACATANPAR